MRDAEAHGSSSSVSGVPGPRSRFLILIPTSRRRWELLTAPPPGWGPEVLSQPVTLGTGGAESKASPRPLGRPPRGLSPAGPGSGQPGEPCGPALRFLRGFPRRAPRGLGEAAGGGGQANPTERAPRRNASPGSGRSSRPRGDPLPQSMPFWVSASPAPRPPSCLGGGEETRSSFIVT